MTTIEDGAPVMLADGRFAIVIRTPMENPSPQHAPEAAMVGVQVPGADDITWLRPDRLTDAGGGALVEIQD